MVGRLKRYLLASAALALAGVVVPATAVSGLSGPSVSCVVRIVDSIPTVEFETTATSGRVVIHRKPFGRMWWRGRVAVESGVTSFTDGPMPKGAATIRYRVTLKDDNGNVITRAKCQVEPSSAGSPACEVNRVDGGYQLATDASGVDDVVYRRRVAEGRVTHWRGVSSADQFAFTDPSSELGFVEYEAIGRRGGVISEVYACGEGDDGGGSDDPECTPISLENPSWDPSEYGSAGTNFTRASARILLEADNVADRRVLIVSRTRYGIFDCGDPGVTWVVNDGENRFYYYAPTQPLGTLGQVTLFGAPEFAGATETLLGQPVQTDDGIYYLAADGLHLARTGTDTLLSAPDALVPFNASLAAAPNGNVYYVMEDPDNGSRFIMYWDASLKSEQVLVQLSTAYSGPDSLTVSDDGSRLLLTGDVEVSSIPL